MCLEAKVAIRDWEHFIRVVRSNLNHTPVPSLANKAPVELFCVLPAASPLDFGFNGEDNTFLELVTCAESDVHASRLKFYADASFEVTEEIREHVATQEIVLTVAELKTHRWNSAKRCYEILVGWKGLEPIEDSWESLISLYKDIPVMVKQYVAATSERREGRQPDSFQPQSEICRLDYKQQFKGTASFPSECVHSDPTTDSDLLTTLCEATWDVSEGDRTDDILLEQIHAITDSYQNQALTPVNWLFYKELKMNVNNYAIQSRVTDYFMSCNKLIKIYGLLTFREGEKRTKKRYKLLANSLSIMLQKKVQNEIEYRSPNEQTNVLKLSKLIKQQSLEQAIEDRPASSSKAPQTVCFHCSGSHYVNNAPTATTEDHVRHSAKTKKKGGALSPDRSGMGMSVYEELVKACPEVRGVSLDEALICEGADGKPIEVNKTLQLHLILRTVADSVRRAKPVECLIIPGNTDEFLLGNDVLTNDVAWGVQEGARQHDVCP
ncbi:unnamed protein product [Phytophthora fragariaefolia]|uniref:Unnamed protein product n=1 Tax=Phytophthora fragariaefolia TaxID=1490495 RepID=A0A9W6XWP3_9STRA|nr:unnamed protein product [Phytophthora fragariaefolia]